MQKHLTRKRSLILGGFLALAVAISAYAYWTAQGTGSGTATVGTDNGLSIANVSFDSAKLYPGATIPVTFKVVNKSDDAPIKFSDVVIDTSQGTNGITVTKAQGATGDCLAGDFTYESDADYGTELAKSDGAAGGDDEQAGSGELTMANSAVNQDGCKNASIQLHLKVASS